MKNPVPTVEYIANQRMAAIGLGQLFDISSNPLPWMNNYLHSDNVQVAPQAEISSYHGQIDLRFCRRLDELNSKLT